MLATAEYNVCIIFCDVQDMNFGICLSKIIEIEYTMMTSDFRTLVLSANSNRNSNSTLQSLHNVYVLLNFNLK